MGAADELPVDADQPTCVGDEVGRVEDLALGQPLGDPLPGEHVVGGAAEDLGPQALDRSLVDHAAQRAGSQHVAVGSPAHRQARSSGHRAPPPGRAASRSTSVIVSTGALGRQQRGQVGADMAEADQDDVRPASAALPQRCRRAGAHRRMDAEGGDRARVAGAAALRAEPDHVVGALGDHGHVARRRCRRPRPSRSGPRATRPGHRSRAAAPAAGPPPAARSLGAAITPLPPPRSSPAAAALWVIASARRMASAIASSWPVVVPEAGAARAPVRAPSSAPRRPSSRRSARRARPRSPRSALIAPLPPLDPGSPTAPRKRAASTPSRARWSQDMQR